MKNYQPGILQPLPRQVVCLTCNLGRSAGLEQVIQVLQTLDTNNHVVAIGQSLLDRFHQAVPGMRSLPAFASSHIGAATATDLWCWIRGDDDIEGGLFQFFRVLNSAYYWCPPASQGKLNLAAINS